MAAEKVQNNATVLDNVLLDTILDVSELEEETSLVRCNFDLSFGPSGHARSKVSSRPAIRSLSAKTGQMPTLKPSAIRPCADML